MVYALLLALALPTYGPLRDPSPSASPAAWLHLPVADGEALIVNSGSTNRAGYQLRVYDTGRLALQQGLALHKRVSPALVKRFFDDLRAAGALDKLPPTRCMKSTSFGSTLQVAHHGAISPDLSCPSRSQAARALAVDALALADAAGVSMLPRTMPLP